MDDLTIPKAQIMNLDSLSDLIRLVVSNSQNRGGYLYYAEHDGEHVFAISHLIPGWYNLRGLPVTLIAKTTESPQSNLILYKFATDDGKESWEYVDQITTNPKNVYIPIIKVAQFPNFLL